MNPLPINDATLSLARELVWFEPPETVLTRPIFLLAYAFVRGTPSHLALLRRYFSDDDLRYALDRAPIGVIDHKSWHYWQAYLGRNPVPPLPERNPGGSFWHRRADTSRPLDPS